MNVVFVNSSRKWGGVKTWTLDAAQGLRALGDDVLIVGRPGPFLDKAAVLGLDALPFAFGFDYNPLTVALFMRLFRKRRADVVVVNVGKDMRTAGVAARLLGIPVAHRIGLPGDMRDQPKTRLTHRFIRPRVLVPCEFIRVGLLANLSFLRPEEVQVVRTGKRPAQEPPTSVGEPPRLIMTSQLNPEKGHDDALRALAELAAKGYDFSLSVVGVGRAEQELRRLAETLGLTDRVRWLGFCSDVAAELRRCDVFLLPSRSEGLPNALLEAMAQGLVPVARDVGGVRETWPEALDWLLLPFESGPDALRDRLERLLALPRPELTALKRAAWTACREQFDLDRQVAELRRWLESVIDRSGAA